MRIRKCQNQSELESVTDDYITRGYKVVSRGENSIKMKEDTGYGSVFWHIVLLLFIPLIGNAIYAWHVNSKGEEVLIKNVEGTE